MAARLPIAVRLTPVSACSISIALLIATAVRSKAPSTFWPRPVLPRSSNAASVPKAERHAVPKSTHGNLSAIGWSGVPER